MTRARDVATQGGLVLVSSTTIGTAVSSVTVNNAFSATYDAYKIIIAGTGVASAQIDLRFTLGASATGYYSGYLSGKLNNNAAFWQGGRAGPTGQNTTMELINPFLATRTTMTSVYTNFDTAGDYGVLGGLHDVPTSFSAFTLTTSSGTITGGTISVYGYRK
jgi:hypothetical protein